MPSTDLDTLDRPKRRQIIDGAALVFNEEGYEGASMSRIAEQARVSKGTLYNYFTSKSDLFTAYVERETADKIAWIIEAGATDVDIDVALRRIARRLMATIMSPTVQTMHRIMVSEAPKFPELARIYFEAGQGRGSVELAGWLGREAARGRLHIDDPMLAADQFVSLCRTKFWLMRCFSVKPDPGEDEIERMVEANIRLFLGTYGPCQRESVTP